MIHIGSHEHYRITVNTTETPTFSIADQCTGEEVYIGDDDYEAAKSVGLGEMGFHDIVGEIVASGE